MPRRTMISATPYIQPEWQTLRPLVGIGGSMFVSALLYFLNLLLTCVAYRRPQHPTSLRSPKPSRVLEMRRPSSTPGASG